MSDPRTDTDLETRLRSAFRATDLPAAPGRLADALERVPDAPVVAGDDRSAPGRSGGRGTTLGLLGVAAVLIVGGALALSGGSRQSTTPPSAAPSPRTGLLVTYQVDWTAAVPYSAETLAREVDVVRRRIDATGVVGATVRADGQDRLMVGIPDGIDPDPLRRLVGQTGRLAFVPLGDAQMEKGDRVDPAKFPELLGGADVSGAVVSSDQTGNRVVEFDLSPHGSDLFAAYTAAHIGSSFAITIDGLVISAPVIKSAIPGGRVEISQSGVGGWDPVEASELAAIVRLGPLPAPLRELSNQPGPIDAPLPGGDPATEPTGAAPSRPSASPATFALELAPAGLGCDAIVPPYRSIVIHLDPNASEPVWAIVDTGARLRVEWDPSDRGLVGPPPMVVEENGSVLAGDGTRIDIPGGAWPSLLDRFVCPSRDVVYVIKTVELTAP